MSAAATDVSVPPGTTEDTEAARARLKKDLLALMDRRSVMEDEMDALRAALGTEGLTTPLVDGEPGPAAATW